MTANDDPHKTRDGHGRYARTINQARRDAHAAELRAEGWTYQQIADELGIDKSGAIHAVRRAIRDACAGPGQDLINLEVQRLEAMYDQVLDILQTDHPVVSHGRIVKDDTGAPLTDVEMKLKAVDRALRTRESFRKLLGLDAPSRVSVDAEQLGREIGRLLDAATSEDDGDDTDA
ncbi:hypothetical protein [Streptomyces sp. SCL15-4]|uniref:hypothetical protein n=1 Tax=Streptomyces sp. SCL15-4 TaxID=2967221 RepID=UPI002965FDB8|nr:hypothetical protein [Streptomyces sp. SCL15-4]